MPEARGVVGIDLSPYMIAVGKHHNQEKNVGHRVSLMYGDTADTRLPDGTTSLVSCTYLLHEMPYEAVRYVSYDPVQGLPRDGISDRGAHGAVPITLLLILLCNSTYHTLFLYIRILEHAFHAYAVECGILASTISLKINSHDEVWRN